MPALLRADDTAESRAARSRLRLRRAVSAPPRAGAVAACVLGLEQEQQQQWAWGGYETGSTGEATLRARVGRFLPRAFVAGPARTRATSVMLARASQQRRLGDHTAAVSSHWMRLRGDGGEGQFGRLAQAMRPRVPRGGRPGVKEH